MSARYATRAALDRALKLAEVIIQQGWRRRAACRPVLPGEAREPVDPDIFWPMSNGHLSTGQLDPARRVCRECPVQQECFDFVMTLPADPGGIWAGTSVHYRTHLRNERAAASR